MCGRATNQDELQDIALGTAAMVADAELPKWRPSYNITITSRIPVVALRGEERVLRVARWGLVPKWVKDEKAARESMGRCFNARGETVATLASFRSAFQARRCLVVVTGFFEWEKVGGDKDNKQPFWIHPAGRERYLTFAGLYETWKNPETAEEWLTTTIVTTTPNEKMARVHNRMPVILDDGGAAAWLNAGTPRAELEALIAPCPDAWLGLRPVSKAVGPTKAQGPELIEPLVPATGEPLLGKKHVA